MHLLWSQAVSNATAKQGGLHRGMEMTTELIQQYRATQAMQAQAQRVEAELRASKRATADLMHWIDSHYPPMPTEVNEDGTLTVYVSYVNCNTGASWVAAEVIPATLSAARDLLGY